MYTQHHTGMPGTSSILAFFIPDQGLGWTGCCLEHNGTPNCSISNGDHCWL